MEIQYEQHLVTAGLTHDEAHAYEILIKRGALQASTLGRLINISSRPLTYKVLDTLIERGLVEKREESGKIAKFYPSHPLKLKEYTESAREKAEQSIIAVDGMIDKLVSEFNLSSGKPGIRYFEGRQGVRAVLNDSLTAKTPIFSYSDVEEIELHYKDVSDPYIKERERLGILKKLLLDDTPFVRNLYKGSEETQSEVHLIPKSQNPYKVAIQIYDDKVSYLTLNAEKEMAIIIQDKEISALQRHLFEELYNRATPLYVPKLKSSGSDSFV